MKSQFISWLLLARTAHSGMARPTEPRTTSNLRLATYNVRYDSMPDTISVQETIDSLPRDLPQKPTKFYGNLTEQPWSTRRIHIANDIIWSKAQIWGGQELHRRQVDDMQELLGPRWSWVGVGRDPANPRSNEYNPIFYQTDEITLKAWDTFWLSATPFEPSKYADAGSFRLCTVARFEMNSRGFVVMNTHLDDQSAGQRALGASLVIHRAKYETVTKRQPVFLTGDFNSGGSDEAYGVIVGRDAPKEINETFRRRFSWTPGDGDGYDDFVMRDLLGETPPQYRSGSYATFTSWAGLQDASSFERLDYIFAGNSGGWQAKAYHVGQSLYDDGIYASDHRPVFVDLEISRPDRPIQLEEFSPSRMTDVQQALGNKAT